MHAWLLFALTAALAAPAPAAPVTALFKLDNFGYRPGDAKRAYCAQDPGAGVQLRRSADDAVLAVLPVAQDLGQEAGSPLIHGDHVWRLDFSAVTATGTVHLYSPALDQRSYDLALAEDAYARPLAGVAKSFYYQRCGTPKPAAYGGAWADPAACHNGDAQATALCDHGADYGDLSYGTLDLSGGWHDAGDYEKKIGISYDCGQTAYADAGQTLWNLLTAYERNPAAFTDGSLNLPESGNGVPDLLDQARWELDWYLKMQRPDGHVLAKVVVTNLGAFSSPPSADHNPRWYGPPTHAAEAIFVACTAHAARVFAGVPAAAPYAQTLAAAAARTWEAWVAAAPSEDNRFWAAAEILRLDPGRDDARAVVESYKAWGGSPWINPGAQSINYGIFTYLSGPSPSPAVAAGMKGSVANLANYIFSSDDSYGSGMPAWLYLWNSNWFKAECGLALLWAADLGATGAHSADQCRAHALDFLHYLHGANPLNMTYLSNAEALGAKHGAWRIFNMWFGAYGDPVSRSRYIGKPAAVADPLYPYVSGPDNYGISDADSSLLGPAPGYVPPGPTGMYASLSGRARPPLLPDGSGAPLAKAYRDWNYGDPSGVETQPWIVNEPGIYDQAAYVALAAAFCPAAAAGPSPTATPASPPAPGSPQGRLRCFPNPSTGLHPAQAVIELARHEDDCRLDVFSVAGSKAFSVELGGLGAGLHRVPLPGGGLGNGVYHLLLSCGTERLRTDWMLLR